ncbi:MAG: 3'-5' exoribonuclease [Candidatus Woesearchaeota archaeon]|jgi:hypothetical protein|nr:3'-5' exoribonuclease [Candidatus Woesearchaeota archaeon]
MSKYFLDTEFHEYKKKGIDTIELISIGIVGEDDRVYYAISKDFNLKDAWNNEWLRENVLKPIWKEWVWNPLKKEFPFNKESIKDILNKYGKTNKQIAEEIKEFVNYANHTKEGFNTVFNNLDIKDKVNWMKKDKPEFYAYYADYDWVVFCWLFGRMIDLPKGFPRYCIDLKQELDRKVNTLDWLYLRDTWNNSRMSIKTIGRGVSQEKDRLATFNEKLKRLKELDEYPKQTNEHNALSDAIWNKELYEFLNNEHY